MNEENDFLSENGGGYKERKINCKRGIKQLIGLKYMLMI